MNKKNNQGKSKGYEAQEIDKDPRFFSTQEGNAEQQIKEIARCQSEKTQTTTYKDK